MLDKILKRTRAGQVTTGGGDRRRGWVQPTKYFQPPEAGMGRASCCLLAVLAVCATACSNLREPPLPHASAYERHEIEQMRSLLAERESQRESQEREIVRLQQLLAEKDAQIHAYQAMQQGQAKTLRETNTQATHARIKLRRMATLPDAASSIAEVEVAMEQLKSVPLAASEKLTQKQAQRLMKAAVASFEEENYMAAMDYAAKASGFLDMINSNRASGQRGSGQVTTPFPVSIPLRATTNSNLRSRPDLAAEVLVVLRKNSAMVADAYQGQWLKVKTVGGQTGWILGRLVEAEEGMP
jgi:hypothetical protein